MNLFVTGWGLDAERCRLAVAALEETAGLYPSLENGEGTTWRSDCGSVVFASQYPSSDYRGQREYVSETEQAIFAYDGLPIDENDQFAAHRAGELGKSWDATAKRMDGFYCGLRINKSPLKLELQFDNFGVYQLFYKYLKV